jgi:hypothetical protein
MRSMTSDQVDLGRDEELFIEWGVARWQFSKDEGKHKCKICEPLVLLAATFRLSLEDGIPLYKHLTDTIEQHRALYGRNGFEAYLAYFFARTFGESERLGAVFDLHEESTRDHLADYTATLVSLYQHDDSDRLEEERVILFSGRNGSVSESDERQQKSWFIRDDGPIRIPGCLGEHANDMEGVVRWLRHRSHTAFCFPPPKMGPDLLFILKLTKPGEDSAGTRYIWVVVQAKWHRAHERSNLRRNEVLGAISSVTPDRYFMDRVSNSLYSFS